MMAPRRVSAAIHGLLSLETSNGDASRSTQSIASDPLISGCFIRSAAAAHLAWSISPFPASRATFRALTIKFFSAHRSMALPPITAANRYRPKQLRPPRRGGTATAWAVVVTAERYEWSASPAGAFLMVPYAFLTSRKSGSTSRCARSPCSSGSSDSFTTPWRASAAVHPDISPPCDCAARAPGLMACVAPCRRPAVPDPAI